MNLIAGVLHLTRKDSRELRITDLYSLHRVVYSLFENDRSKPAAGRMPSSGILFADLGGDHGARRVLLLADRSPAAQIEGKYGEVQSKPVPAEFLQHDRYRFEVIVNPTRRNNASRKLVPVKGRDKIMSWFSERAPDSWGFEVEDSTLQVDEILVHQFQNKHRNDMTIMQARLKGSLSVVDREKFIKGFAKGLGRAKTFGCGLLQIRPQ